MTIEDIILYLFIGSSIAAVLVMILNRNIFYAALGLLVCLISLSGIYALLQAEFLAVTQLLIYAGGVLVLIIFGIMLTNRISGKSLQTDSHNLFLGIVFSTVFFGVICFSFFNTGLSPVDKNLNTVNHMSNVGTELMSTYVAPFEVSGILLLVCLIGAALTASSFKKNLNG
jgi:NADH:ubiquinone oxidoreductase subunit 6 (subunit J)